MHQQQPFKYYFLDVMKKDLPYLFEFYDLKNECQTKKTCSYYIETEGDFFF